MANKRIAQDAPDTVAGVQRRVNAIEREAPEARADAFDSLVLDTLVGIAQAGCREGYRAPDDPVEVAREVLRYGAVVYADSGGAEWWITWLDYPDE